jgi:HEAT repeat protein
MDVKKVLADTQLKAKDKVNAVCKMLLDDEITLVDLIETAKVSVGSDKANCIEAIESATRVTPEIASLECLKFVTKTLLDESPRVKWESAKVIGNIAHLYPGKLDRAVCNLLINSEFPGTVVRWSAAFALGQIIKLGTRRNKELVPAAEALVKREKDRAIQKLYQAALKQTANNAKK